MKKFEVVLDYVPNKSDFDNGGEPRTASKFYEIEAENEASALVIAKSQFGECVWSSDVYEV